MSTRIGIVGMPNAGKSSLFNALTKAGAEAANYPFTTIEPNVAVVPVRDERMEQVAKTVGASEIVWDTIDFHDIAGLVAGAHEGEGLGNRFLANIRETDAIVHVVRAHDDENVIHPEGRVDPLRGHRDDRDGARAGRPRAGRAARGAGRQTGARRRPRRDRRGGVAARGDRGAAGAAARRARVPVPEEAPNAARDLGSLTSKPVLFVANVDEGSEVVPAAVAEHAAAQGARAVAVSSRIEAELAELEDEDAAAMREELGVSESGLAARRARGVRAARADRVLHRRRGQAGPVLAPAQRAHRVARRRARSTRDIQKGFVRAEVIGWRELVDAGGYAGARERGTLRLEGRDYVMADGDVITVKFTP